jgi:hypothetical protein
MPCDLATTSSYTWNYDNVPPVDFEMELQPAPRFDLEVYESVDAASCKHGPGQFIEK